MEWTSKKIRETFLSFFKDKEHQIVFSAPMVVKNDPTLMFVNAGMNQFKEYFLGDSKPREKRVADTQKCLRVSGKHNDLEEVGVDTYHHTMFEMLGNWSFGDYFKKEAIEWAWELLTEVYKLDKNRMYITVFAGDANDKLELDADAKEIWKGLIDENRILECDRKDNFWEMGETGPCGPCSEIHVDLRSNEEREKIDGKTLVNGDHPQVVEIWNLVFIQYNRKANGELVDLPNKHIDTGMGFERLTMALQQQKSNYDTDIFMPLIRKIEEISGKGYEATDSKKDIAIRVISDHVRAISFSIADGQLPSNTGAGYVIRRILRRAIRYGYSFLDLNEPFVNQLVEVLVSEMGAQFPELKAQQSLITKVILEEEESFLRTLERGIARFEGYAAKNRDKNVEGKFAFDLYDTFGFPIDLTELLASEKGLHVDMQEFFTCLQQQKDRSRKATIIKTDDWVKVIDDEQKEFIGYDQLEAKIKITRYRKVNIKGKEQYQLVFNLTPFYAEGGGQIGDIGYLSVGDEKVEIVDTKKENNVIVHFIDELPKDVTANFKAVVNVQKRELTESNHSATHLLHEALRKVLGTHVEQKGSLVNDKHLRFDFSHFQKMTSEEVRQIEELVNNQIRKNVSLEENRNTPIEQAKDMGAMALFGEKYGDLVRVIKFGSSVELCGGTHVDSTANIGLFKITHESAVAAGIRRIEAITNKTAEVFVTNQLEELNLIKGILKNPKNVQQAIKELLERNNRLNKQIEALNRGKAEDATGNLMDEVIEINGIRFIGKEVELDNASIKDVAFQLKGKNDNLFMIFGNRANGKATLTIAISDNLVKEKGMHAGNLVRELAKEIQGGGGGQPFFATAGGKNPDGIAIAIEKAKIMLG
ncbi:MAG: alanine--tRNA ligase [Flavobacteriales bacterium]|nr:alanine--tRNA ligase [Flavobacteriales bacterium]